PVVPVEPVIVADPTTVFTPDEMPAIEAIERAAADFDADSDLARRADRGKRKARKILDRLPAGVYGSWIVDRVESNRMVADLETIRATYARLGLGDLPMKAPAASLRVMRAETVVPAVKTLAAVAA
ncbi:hypothetical protein, partial [Candidatus Protofrankia californiensis]|uniref:hypothetical protein n=1 Tax=Candidatus Protofrankia californiensis TaxID=1839754 RepID=UPI0019D0D381